MHKTYTPYMKVCSKKLQTFMFHAIVCVNRILCPVFNAGTQLTVTAM